MTPLLSIDDLHIVFDTDRGPVRAVNGLSLSIRPGETLGLVGESGCGKTITAQAILRLIPSPPGRISQGRVEFDGQDLLALGDAQMRRIRGAAIGMVFQEPLSALNPVMNIGSQLTELIRAHERGTPSETHGRIIQALRDAGLPEPEAIIRAYPHELSGGMRQRVLIAMAIVLRPKLVIADEPTTALDVTIQAQLIGVFKRLKAEHGMTMLLISHDLGVVMQLADRIAVMYAGHIVEEAPADVLLASPRHPYTRGLLNSIPGRNGAGQLPTGIPGSVPDPVELPSGCPFHPRCPRALDICKETMPGITQGSAAARSAVRFACHNPEPES